MIFPTMLLWETKGLRTRNVEKHTIQTQSLATAEGRLKPHLTPPSPKVKVTRLSFFILPPRLLTWQLPNVAGLTSEAEGPRPPVGCYGSFLGTAAPFDGSWKPPWGSGNSGFNFCSSMNQLCGWLQTLNVSTLTLGQSLKFSELQLPWLLNENSRQVVFEVPSNSHILLFYQIPLARRFTLLIKNEKHIAITCGD